MDALCPAGWKSYSDEVNGRWQLYSVEGKTISRSWQAYGYEEAGRMALTAAWSHYLCQSGLPTSSCPVQGLLGAGETTATAVASAAASSSGTAGGQS